MGGRSGVRPARPTPAQLSAVLALVALALVYLIGRPTEPAPALSPSPFPTTSPSPTITQSPISNPQSPTPLVTLTPLPPTPTLIPTIAPAVLWLEQIETAERAWQARPVSHYRIYVSIHSQSYQALHDIIVRHDQVLSYTSTCTIPPTGCTTPRYPAETFTIAGLFAVARSHSGRAGARYSTIAFDQTYHFPALIVYDRPDETGDEEIWQVDSFVVLESTG